MPAVAGQTRLPAGGGLPDGVTRNTTRSKLKPPPKFRGWQAEIKPICSRNTALAER